MPFISEVYKIKGMPYVSPFQGLLNFKNQHYGSIPLKANNCFQPPFLRNA